MKTELLALQARLGLTNGRMAAYLGVPIATWSKWSKGEREPPAVARRLIEVLGVIEALDPAVHNALLPKEK